MERIKTEMEVIIDSNKIISAVVRVVIFSRET